MHIAMIAPLWERVPPVRYGGTELVIHLITEELVKRGHQVTLFASGNSKTSARLVSTIPKPFREHLDIRNLVPTSNEVTMHQVMLLGQVLRESDRFDIIHNHTAFQMLPFAGMFPAPVLTTIHGTFEPETLKTVFREYGDLPYVSISDRQRSLCPELNYVETIYHGLNLSHYSPSFSYADKTYLAFLGRFSPEKGAHLALKAAKETGWPLVLAGKINPWEESYFDQEIKPHLDGKDYVFIGEVNFPEKMKLLQNAVATLFPIEWEEPFGLVMIESMACGTPVVALKNGSVAEVIDHGQSGFVADDYAGLVEGIQNLRQLNRDIVYDTVSRRFTVERMVDQYLNLYEKLVCESDDRKSLNQSAVI